MAAEARPERPKAATVAVPFIVEECELRLD